MTIPATPRGLDVRPRGALSIGAVLDTGVVSLPAAASHAAGPASLVAWVALLALSVPLAVTFAALGSRYPDGGGVSTYARRAFGPGAAMAVGRQPLGHQTLVRRRHGRPRDAQVAGQGRVGGSRSPQASRPVRTASRSAR